MMIAQKPNHFTCTLAEALEWNKAHFSVKTEQTTHGVICRHDEFQNISEFVEFLAKSHGQSLALGCVTPKSTLSNNPNELVEEVLTFKEVQEQSYRLSQHFLAQFGPCEPERKCVALMASSSIIYALVWLALIQAGYEVMLLVSRNPSNASRHLLKISNAFALCYDQDHEQNISEVLLETNNSEDLSSIPLPNLLKFKIPWLSLKSLICSCLDTFDISSTLIKKQDLTSVAFHNQSSGTTGLPKMISQTHNGQVAVLPRLQEQDVTSLRQSTFTTTPLCTGWIADMLRSWSAATPIWLFPENRAPIIGKFVLAFFRHIDALSLSSTIYLKFRLAYLSCVPFVLESLLENPELKKRLLELNAVGVGGAAMTTKLGDQLVADGFPLVSRFGSSECGFLLSSYRDYKKDRFWQALRGRNSTGLNFQSITGERYELIVEADCPLVSTSPHALRPFNTHDVFIPHDSLSNSWCYIGRSDSLLTLITGKKFDPVPLEEALNCHPLIGTTFIVGNDRPYPVAIIFGVSEEMSIDEEKRHQQIWRYIQQVNEKQPTYAKILKNNYRVLDFSQQSRVKKNNKGGLIRCALLKELEEEVNEIYESSQSFKNVITNLFSVEKIFQAVQVAVNSIVNTDRELNPNDDLFEAGIDSVMSLQIRKSICEIISPELRSSVAQNIVYECGTISSLADFFIKLLNLNKKLNTDLVDETKSKHAEMQSMVEKNLDIQQKSFQRLQQSKFVIAAQARNQNIVALTGATGFLGIHILDTLMRDPNISKIYLLIRGTLTEPYGVLCKQAENRVRSRLDFYKINVDRELLKKITYTLFQIKEIDLGIPSPLYSKMASEISCVIHAAWDVC
ncbi:Adenylate-forming reductase Nps10 [Erysiphe neolycopersici]|uniref:Adenylate-forming reductase Nps10 n=1 Tax=Erysiphe neolycopersici TaxID=212602 RepID=A0A420I2W3_9PEZI|nr:Adenylate-forming reductase Nps10 [Erysiphe neolycopersici]